MYVNQKISDLISNAEMEQNDYRRGGKPNVFFGEEKRYFGVKFGVFTFNTAVLVGSTIALLGFLHWILRRQLGSATKLEKGAIVLRVILSQARDRASPL